MERNLDFDQIVNRRGSNCLKYDFAKRRGMPEDVLPLWVADMDFKTSSYIEDALVQRSAEAVFGYSDTQEDYFNILKKWFKERHAYDIEEDWLIKTPGVVCALALCVKAYTKPGDSVLIQLPVYYPFSEVIRDNGRTVVSNDLYLAEDGKYHIDFDDFEQKIIDHEIKLFLLCNPHNPVGRVWTEEELVRIGEICKKHGVIVVSDEIHHDIIFDAKHHVFAGVRPEFEAFTITCTSASKTFNLASVLLSNIFIADASLRQRFKKELDAVGISQLSVFGIIATEVAYKQGVQWYEAMLQYVKENVAFAKKFVAEQMPGVTMIDPEGTYLIWLDFRTCGLCVKDLDDRIVNEAKLWLDSGKIFGKSGEGFERINVACPRAVLEEALLRLKSILQDE